ncbi:MAG: hypothetical protein ABIH03_13360 [Pseudomonadota bacterium]
MKRYLVSTTRTEAQIDALVIALRREGYAASSEGRWIVTNAGRLAVQLVSPWPMVLA